MTFPHSGRLQTLVKSNGMYDFTNGDTVDCFLQPITGEEAQLFGIVFSKGFVCFVPYETTITEKMQIVIDDVTYGVKGVKVHNYGSIKHKKAILEKI